MTGSLALVMAAFAPARGWAETEAQSADRILRHSRYSLVETAQRIEEAARNEGLSVLVRMGGQRPVIVLASAQGGTPVMLDEASSRLAMPMSVELRETADGGADVSIDGSMGAASERRWDGLPSAVVAELAALPVLLERALT